MSSERARLFALQMVFALNAIGLAVWFPRIPDVKEALGLDVLTLAFCLFGMPVGTMLGFLSVGRIIRRLGTPGDLRWGGSVFLLSFIGPGLAPNAVTLGLALFLCGLTIATIEVSMNAKASQTERVLRAADHDAVPRLLELRHGGRRDDRRRLRRSAASAS